jgi:hypothetical protein
VSGGTQNISDFYEIYMWNYCRGSTVNGTETVTYCSPRQAKYSFDPFTEWGLSSSSALKVVNGSVDGAIKAYQKGSQWMFIAYCVAFWVTVATIVVGLFAICSRVGSCLTTFVSGVCLSPPFWRFLTPQAATLFTIIAAVVSTILFSTVVGALNASLSADGIHSTLGTRMLAVDWLAVAFSLGASFFWLISICCCSPHSSRRKDRGVASNIAPKSNVAAFAPFGNRGYQPLADPVAVSGVHQNTAYGGAAQYGNTTYGGRGGVEMQDMGYTEAAGPYKGRDSGYEPFRHERV